MTMHSPKESVVGFVIVFFRSGLQIDVKRTQSIDRRALPMRS